MARLPTVGGSDGIWANLLTEFIELEHTSDGTHGITLVGARMSLAGAKLNLTDGAETLVVFDTDEYDYNNLTDIATGKITTDKAGMYMVNGQITFDNAVNNVQLRVDVKKTGNIVCTNLFHVYAVSSYDTFTLPFSILQQSTGSDYFQVYVTVTGNSTVDLVSSSAATYLEVYRVGVLLA